MNAEFNDDDLARFESQGGTPLPAADEQGWLEHDGARIWHASFGHGPAVVLLHGGLGHSGNWGNQVPALLAAGYRAIVIDSRGHGRSTRDDEPYSYERMASDVLAVLDALHVDRARFVGWSDGACIALVLADRAPERAAGVFFFACNMDPSGTKEIVPKPAARPLLRAAPQGLRGTVRDAGPVRRLRRGGQRNDAHATGLPRAGSRGDRRSGDDRAGRARRIHPARARGVPGKHDSGRDADDPARREPFRAAAAAERFNAAMLAFLGRLPG